MDSLDLNIHSHVPYVVILLQAAQKWKDSHSGKMPQNFKEKNEFKEFIKSLAKDYSKELNFEEAIKNAHLFYKDEGLPENV
jgi:amyloid beta precursor protein binding protein 1